LNGKSARSLVASLKGPLYHHATSGTPRLVRDAVD
jgi:hypothetical protein